ncbi:hypothetical protein QA645_22885 [Bradyrhizobium sp. CIAT3101]|uniref:hypothetical protein n=1 Tax=Bradyrhizobium sp. CIAT3101 TaxID=439387 RepID=UPI0024B07352|nr:hypothetical protein [Bradyrhizobium sp. CIAT3101]WFU77403.1 hypothetical protein QA645_22885 [Bradyrhizobium sp. CIAT3101]
MDEAVSTQLDRNLWRYMSFTKFLWLIQNRKLWFSRADKLNDPWELALAGDQLEHVILRRPIRSLQSDVIEEPILDRARRINKLWRETTYISCWSSSDHESYALWRIFCGSTDGVAICAPSYNLTRAFQGVSWYPVTYDAPGTEIRTPSPTGLATRKRLMFQYEREVRAIITDGMIGTPVTWHEFGCTCDFDPELLISSIAVHPEADSTLMDAVVRVVRDYTPKLSDNVAWSKMREPPPLLK